MNSRMSWAVMAIFLIFSGSVWAQMGPPGGGGRGMVQRDPVVSLNNSLKSAGAPALDERQQQELATLVSNFRTAHPLNAFPESLQAARQNLEAAILARDETAVDAAANELASRISERAAVLIRDVARFQIQVLAILSEEQANALKSKYGSSGLVLALGSLVHHGFGPGMHRSWK